jgi:hypothetical protein
MINNQYVYLGDGKRIEVKGIGNVVFKFIVNNEFKQRLIKEVLYIPALSRNLLSVSKLVEDHEKVIQFDSSGGKIINRRLGLIAEIENIEGGLFRVRGNARAVVQGTLNKESLNYWHCRLGHLNEKDLKVLVPNATGKLDFCNECLQGRMKHLPFGKYKKERSGRVLDVITIDKIGPMEEETYNGDMYAYVIVDEASGYSVALTCESGTSGELLGAIKIYNDWAVNQTGLNIRNIKMDNGPENIGQELHLWCQENGINLEFGNPYTPENQGIAERKIQTLVNTARSLLAKANMKKSYWGDALLTANYIRNRCPRHYNNGMCPYERFHGKKPQYNYMKIFGCRGWVLQRRKHIKHLQRWERNAKEYVFIGYTNNGYKMMSIDESEVIYSRNIIFNEALLGFPHNWNVRESENIVESIIIESDDEESKGEESNSEEEREQSFYYDIDEENENTSENTQEPDETIMTSRIMTRSMLRRQNQSFGGDILLVENGEIWNDDLKNESYKNILKRPDGKAWKYAVSEELKALEDYGTWVGINNLPLGAKALNTKWVFTYKLIGNKLERRKARLTVKGFGQRYGIDYLNTFATVPSFSVIRMLTVIQAAMGLKKKQYDFSNAFMNNDLKEDVFINVPAGYEGKYRYLKLVRALNGLKQASHTWSESLRAWMIEAGYLPTIKETCLYVKRLEKRLVLVVVWVDDVKLYYENGTKDYVDFEEKVMSRAKSKEVLTDIFVKMTFRESSQGIAISQQSYFEEKARIFEVEKLKKTRNTPLDLRVDEKLDLGGNDAHETYQSLIGTLLYAMNASRPDITYAVCRLARFGHNHGLTHWNAGKGVLKYLLDTKNTGLFINYGNDMKLEAYVDASFRNPRSITGYVVKFGGMAISWRSKLQGLSSQNTMEAEYVALSEVLKEIIFFQHLLEEIGINVEKPTTIYEDNRACEILANNPEFRDKAKHIEIRYHKIRDEIRQGSVSIKRVESENQIADIFTKVVDEKKFTRIRGELSLLDSLNHSIGGDDNINELNE